MSFNSFEFLLFYPAVLVLYYIVPLKFRWMFLLACSYFFYFRGGSVLFLLLITVPDYFIAGYIARNMKHRKFAYAAGVVFSLLLLVFFKFALSQNGISTGIQAPLFLSGPVIGAVLPLGISFIILRKISYLTDVYQNTTPAEKNFGKYALYLSYFPSVASGPIDRYANYKKGVERETRVDYDGIVSGLRLILTGLFKKLFIAERLAFLVNEVYSSSSAYSGITVLLAVYFFAFQIYADFSGYTDIAMGISRTLGLELPANFNNPYFSRSVSEFWRRWHMTLSSWLRDYLFMPLASAVSSKKFLNRAEKYRDILAYVSAALVTWFLAGAWHGNGLTMIVWGALQAVYLAFSHITKKPRKKFSKAAAKFIPQKYQDYLRVLFTFNLVTFTWVFFRSESLSGAASIFGGIFRNITLRSDVLFAGISRLDVLLSLLGIASMIYMDVSGFIDDKKFFSRPEWYRWTVYYALLFLTLFFGIYKSSGFLYVKF